MPVIFNEPLSFLQRIVEYMEYANLLSKAAMCDDPVQRIEVMTDTIWDDWARGTSVGLSVRMHVFEVICYKSKIWKNYRIIIYPLSYIPAKIKTSHLSHDFCCTISKVVIWMEMTSCMYSPNPWEKIKMSTVTVVSNIRETYSYPLIYMCWNLS